MTTVLGRGWDSEGNYHDICFDAKTLAKDYNDIHVLQIYNLPLYIDEVSYIAFKNEWECKLYWGINLFIRLDSGDIIVLAHAGTIDAQDEWL